MVGLARRAVEISTLNVSVRVILGPIPAGLTKKEIERKFAAPAFPLFMPDIDLCPTHSHGDFLLVRQQQCSLLCFIIKIILHPSFLSYSERSTIVTLAHV